MKSEAAVQSEIREQAGRDGVWLMRNNVGACTDDTGRMIRYGLGNDSAQLGKRIASSDLIGLAQMRGPKRVIVMEANTSLGRFLAVECKREGWTYNPNDQRERAQCRFLHHVRRRGGLGGFAASVDDYRAILAGTNTLPPEPPEDDA